MALVFGALVFISNSASADLVVNGGFDGNNESGGWSAETSVPGWTLIGPDTATEIGTAGVYGLSSYTSPSNITYTQLVELNGNQPDTIQQTITGLIVGNQYNLSWAYGDRSGGGDTSTQVSFGGALVANDFSNVGHTNSWVTNSFLVTATATTENLVFAGISGTFGSPSYGNLITGVSLTPAAVPIPATIWLFGSALMGLGAFRKKIQVQSIA